MVLFLLSWNGNRWTESLHFLETLFSSVKCWVPCFTENHWATERNPPPLQNIIVTSWHYKILFNFNKQHIDNLEVIAVCKDNYVVYACGFDWNGKWEWFYESKWCCKMTLQKWRCKNDVAKWHSSPNEALASRAGGNYFSE